MNNDLNNISPNNNNLDKEKLLQQLNEDLFSDDDAIDDDFETDAEIGLKQLDQNKVTQIVDKLNADLSRHLSKKKKRRGIFNDPSNIYVTIITILLLIILAYIVISRIL